MKTTKNLEKDNLIYDLTKKPILNKEDIKKFLPHREPFLFIDSIIKIELIEDTKDEISAGSYIIGIKKAEFAENFPVFDGHFPSEPIFPGVLLLECMAQIGGILILHKTSGENSTYLTAIDKVKFKSKVLPGDLLVFKVIFLWKKMGIVSMKGEGYVEGKLVIEAEIKAQIIEKANLS